MSDTSNSTTDLRKSQIQNRIDKIVAQGKDPNTSENKKFVLRRFYKFWTERLYELEHPKYKKPEIEHCPICHQEVKVITTGEEKATTRRDDLLYHIECLDRKKYNEDIEEKDRRLAIKGELMEYLASHTKTDGALTTESLCQTLGIADPATAELLLKELFDEGSLLQVSPNVWATPLSKQTELRL
jgi:hypothetical protein